MTIQFSKMQGLGNDFMVIENITQKVPLSPELIIQWGDRHTGVGFDQLLLIEEAKNSKTDFFYRIFNCDGSEVSQCGNGARCIGKFLWDKHFTQKNPIRVGTLAGQLSITRVDHNLFAVNMGLANFIPERIPFIAAKQQLTYELNVNGNIMQVHALSIGNPHCIVFVDYLDGYPVDEIGRQITSHPAFPQKTNVEFVQFITPQTIHLRVYERGTGETLACGSGACAAVIAGRALGKLDSQVVVKQAGGELKVVWLQTDETVILMGPANHVFSGEIEI